MVAIHAESCKRWFPSFSALDSENQRDSEDLCLTDHQSLRLLQAGGRTLGPGFHAQGHNEHFSGGISTLTAVVFRFAAEGGMFYYVVCYITSA